MFVGGSALTELIPVAVNPGNNCLPLPKVIEDTKSDSRNETFSLIPTNFSSTRVYGSWKWSIVRPAYVCLHFSALLHVLLSQHALGFGERAVDAMVSCRGLF